MRLGNSRTGRAAQAGFVFLVAVLLGPVARGFVFLDSVWPDGNVVMQLQLQSGGPSAAALTDGAASWNDVAQSALTIWNQNLHGTQFTWVNNSNAAKAAGNRLNNVFWAADVYGETLDIYTLGVTMTDSNDDEPTATVEADVIFNTRAEGGWNSYRGYLNLLGVTDFRRVALHEFGHVLGLGHPDEDAQSVVALMNSRVGDLDGLAADDLAGIAYLYGLQAAPTVIVQPTAVTTMADSSAAFKATVSGRGPMSYQWQKDGVSVGIDGASYVYLRDGSADYRISYCAPLHLGEYRVAVANRYGVTYSSPARLSFNEGFKRGPENQTAVEGETVSFSVEAVAGSGVTYQWIKSNSGPQTTIPGATGATLILNHVTQSDDGDYLVRLRVGEKEYQASARLKIKLGFATAPQSQAVDLGASVTLTAEVIGTPRLNVPRGILAGAAGEFYVGDGSLRKIGSDGALSTMTANLGAQLLARDAAGNFFTAAAGGTAIIWKPVNGPEMLYAGRLSQAGSGAGSRDQIGFSGIWGLAAAPDGTLFVADMGNGVVTKIAANGIASRLAGDPAGRSYGTQASVDGTGSAARFSNLRGIALDAAGNLYVADEGSNENGLIRKVTPAGVVTTLAGNTAVKGTAGDGTGTGASFWSPTGMAIDTAGNLIVSDRGTIRKVTLAGVVTTLAGTANAFGSADGTGPAARFSEQINGLCVAADNTIYVADSYNFTVRKVTAAGVVTTYVGEKGKSNSTDGRPLTYQWLFNGAPITGANGASLTLPSVQLADEGEYGLRISNDIGVATSAPARIGIRPTITRQPVSTVAMKGEQATLSVSATSPNGRSLTYQWKNAWTDADIPGATGASWTIPQLDLASATNYYVVISDGLFTTKSQSAGISIALQMVQAPTSGNYLDGAKLQLSTVVNSSEEPWFGSPTGIVADGAGNLFVADASNYVVRKIDASGTSSLVAGKPREFGFVDGVGDAARFSTLSGLTRDASGNLYVADYAAAVRKITPGGVVTTLAGQLGQSGSADGAGGAARFNWPNGIVCNGQGELFVCDTSNHTVRKITPDGVVSTFAGKAGEPGYANGAGGAARFQYPWGITVDGSGYLYVTDGNAVIRRISPQGEVSLWAGQPGVAGTSDGARAVAAFYRLRSLCFDPTGNLFVVDGEVVRKIAVDGEVTTYAGSTFSQEQRLNSADGIAISPAGVVFVADSGNSVVRKVGFDAVATYAGTPGIVSYREGTLTHYQWRYNGADIVGATDSLLDVTDNFQAANVGKYSVTVSNRYGSLSAEATVADIVVAPWNIIFDLSTRTAAVSDAVTFRVSAAGTGQLSYQWLKNGSVAPGATSNVFTLSKVVPADAGSYAVTVSNALGQTTTKAAALNVTQPGAPVIATQPVSYTSIQSGFSVALSVVATGAGPLHYQWMKDGVEIAGATAATFTLPHALQTDTGNYTVRVSTDTGQIVSGVASVYVNAAQMPVFNYPPQSRTVTVGDNVSIDAGVAFINSYTTYQWSKNGRPISGATASVLRFQPVAVADEGSYTVVVTTDAGSITSVPAVLTVTSKRAFAGSYLGELANGRGSWALTVNEDGSAVLLGYSSAQGSSLALSLLVRDDGLFSESGTAPDGLSVNTSRSAAEKSASALPLSTFGVNGRIVGETVTGSFGIWGESFSGTRDHGPELVKSGYYHVFGVGGSSADLRAIIGPSGTMLAVITGPSSLDSAVAVLQNGQVTARTTANGQFSFNVNPTTQVVSATLTPAGVAAPVTFAGLIPGATSGARLVNIAARAYCSTGNKVTIGGFVVSGSTTKRVLVRAVGPTLTAQGIGATEVLADPSVEVHDAVHGNSVIATNDNWGDNANAAAIASTASTVGATALLGSDSKSSALLLDLNPGVYSFVVKGAGTSSGVVLLEVYDADATATGTNFSNIATRAYATTGNGVTIGGFVVSGNAPKRVLLRAVGPTLTTQGLGVVEVLTDPQIELHDASHGNAVIATNDDWGTNANASAITTTGARIGATPFDASDTKSAALLLTLQPGVYSFVASGKTNAPSGIVLVEVYDAD